MFSKFIYCKIVIVHSKKIISSYDIISIKSSVKSSIKSSINSSIKKLSYLSRIVLKPIYFLGSDAIFHQLNSISFYFQTTCHYSKRSFKNFVQFSERSKLHLISLNNFSLLDKIAKRNQGEMTWQPSLF